MSDRFDFFLAGFQDSSDWSFIGAMIVFTVDRGKSHHKPFLVLVQYS